MRHHSLKIKPLNNWVIIKPSMNMHHTPEGISVDTSYEEEHHAPRKGIVMAVPDELYFTEKGPDSLPWDTDMELKFGDEVIYHFLSATTALDKHDGRYVEVDGQIYIYVKYDRIFTTKRREFTGGLGNWKETEVVKCLNGFVLVEPMEEHGQLPSWLVKDKKKDKFVGRVAHVGSLVRSYRKSHVQWHGPDQDNIQVGDVVVMDKVCDIPLEYPIHASVFGRQVYYRVQRRYILAKYIDGQFVDPNYKPENTPQL